MTESESRTELVARATKAIISERSGGIGVSGNAKRNDFLVDPDTDLKRILDIVQNDPVVRGAITTKVDRTLESGYCFYGKDQKSRKDDATNAMEELRFDSLMRPLLQHLFTYSNAFIEIVKAGEKPVELYMIDPRFLEVLVDKHGVVQQYVQKIGEQVVTWSEEEVVHLKTTPLSNAIWGDVDIKALWTACALKYHIKKLYLWMYETNQFRPLLNIKDSTDEQIKRFLTFLDQARTDIKKLVPIEGEVESIFLGQMQDYGQVKQLLTYLDYEILNLLQVPPIAVGLPDNSNRSNSDAQERAFNTHIRSIQGIISDIVSHDLMPKLGFEKVYLKFNTIDEKVMIQSLETAERMKNMGIKGELIKEFLISKGWEFPAGDIFDPNIIAQKSMDQFPSRQGKTPGMANQKIGTGDQGTTRQDQLVSRTKQEPSWKKYAYIEVEQ